MNVDHSYPLQMVYRSGKLVRTIAPMPTALVSYLVIGPNPDRKGLFLYNQAGNTAYYTLGDGPATTNQPAFIIPTFNFFRMDSGIVWTGAIYGIRNAGTNAGYLTAVYELV